MIRRQKPQSGLLMSIVHEEALEAEHGAKAHELREQYFERNRKFKNGQEVDYKNPWSWRPLKGKIHSGHFHTSPFGIIYYIRKITKKGESDQHQRRCNKISEKNLLELNKEVK